MAYTTIDNPGLFFNTKLYTSTNSELAISGIGFAPNWVWIKSRSDAHDHHIYDTIRGATKQLNSLNTDAEATRAQGLKSFDSDGFTLGTDGNVNESGSETYASWNWKAGTSFTNDASSTGIGNLDSTGSANTTSGFSIVSYVGTSSSATVAHGLSAVPGLIIWKNRSAVGNWVLWHKDLGGPNKAMTLQEAETVFTSTAFMDNTLPTSSVFSVGDYGNTNGGSENIIAYCFAEKQGYSKFGKYTVSPSENNFIYLGFKPAFLIVKQIEAGGNLNWGIFDSKRPGFNNANSFIYANTNAAEDTSNAHTIDLISNGLRLRANTVGVNPGKEYIYWAFAAEPFVSSGGVPATAR